MTAATMTYEEALTAYLALVTKIHADHFSVSYPSLTPPTFSVAPGRGRSFDKIVRDSASVHSFVCKKDGTTKALGSVKRGDIHKAAGWKAPAKHARGSIFGNAAEALDQTGFTKYIR